MNLLDTLKQAREALEMAGNGHTSVIHCRMAFDNLTAAIEVLQGQEPVAWSDGTELHAEQAFKVPPYERNPPIIFNESAEIVLSRAEYNELRAAAQAVVDEWFSPKGDVRTPLIDRLRKVLEKCVTDAN